MTKAESKTKSAPKRASKPAAKPAGVAAKAAQSARGQVERSYEKVKASIGDVNEHLCDLREFGGDAVGTVRASSTATINGIKEFDREILDYAKSSWSETTDTTKAVFSAKNLSQVADIHTQFVTTSIEKTAKHWKSLADISARSALSAFEPWAKGLGQLATYTDKARSA